MTLGGLSPMNHPSAMSGCSPSSAAAPAPADAPAEAPAESSSDILDAYLDFTSSDVNCFLDDLSAEISAFDN